MCISLRKGCACLSRTQAGGVFEVHRCFKVTLSPSLWPFDVTLYVDMLDECRCHFCRGWGGDERRVALTHLQTLSIASYNPFVVVWILRIELYIFSGKERNRKARYSLCWSEEGSLFVSLLTSHSPLYLAAAYIRFLWLPVLSCLCVV